MKEVEIIKATGARSKKITQKVYLEASLAEIVIHIPFLVVNSLNIEVILGSNILSKKEMTNDFSKWQSFEHIEKRVDVPLKERNKISQGVIRLIKMRMLVLIVKLNWRAVQVMN